MKSYTQLVHPKSSVVDPYQANCPPIYQTATFAQESLDERAPYDYTRSGNPTRTLVAEQIAELEAGQFGFLFSSGMAALATVVGLLNPGDRILVGDDIYGGTHRLVTKHFAKYQLEAVFVDTTDLNKVAAALTDKTKMVLIETPTNPLQKITDIKALAELVHAHQALLAVDNTFLSPWLQQPLTLGADIVIHSATKNLSGHSDVTAGAVVVNEAKLSEQIAFSQNAAGNALAPFESWLLSHNLKTLGLRVERQQANAKKIVTYLAEHPKVKKVFYAGLPNHPGYALNQAQAKGAGSLISFTTDSLTLSKKLVEGTQLFTTAVSFGSLKSLISLPCYMSHASISAAERRLPEDLVRLAIGIEDVEDLIFDLEQNW